MYRPATKGKMSSAAALFYSVKAGTVPASPNELYNARAARRTKRSSDISGTTHDISAIAEETREMQLDLTHAQAGVAAPMYAPAASPYTPRAHRVMLASTSAEVPIRHCRGGEKEVKSAFSSEVRKKFYGSATKPEKITSSAQQGGNIEGKQVGLMEDLLPMSEGGSGSGLSKAGGMYMPPVVGKMRQTPEGTPVVDLTPSHQKRVEASRDNLLETMHSEPYKSELIKLFDQYRALQEIRAAPGLSSKKIGIMMREGKIVDLRVSKGVISVILREVSAKDIHHVQGVVHGSGAGSGMGQVMLNFRSFCIFIAVMSVKKYSDRSPEEALKTVLEDHLLPLIVESEERRFRADPSALEVMKTHHEMLVAMFSHYCAKEQDHLQTDLGRLYSLPERLFKLGLDGAQMFAEDMKISKKLMSQEAATNCFDDVLVGTEEKAMRFPEFIQWLARLAKECFDTRTYVKLTNPAQHTAQLMKVIDSAHETVLVMHMRGQVNGDPSTFEAWEHMKKGERIREPPVGAVAIEKFVEELEAQGNMETLISIFKYYAATCTLSVVPQCEMLSNAGFVRLCREAGLFGKGSRLTRPMAEVIFMDHVVASHKKEETEDIRLSIGSHVHETLKKLKPKVVNLMHFDHFIKALGSCANLKFGKGEGLDRHMKDPVASMMRVITEFILPNCNKRLDPFVAGDALFHSDEVEALLDMYDQPLQAIFVACCTLDCRSCPRWEMAKAVDPTTGQWDYTLSFIKFWEFCKEFELSCVREGIQPQVARHQVAYVFMCANRAGMKADEDQTTCSYEEFRETLARLAIYFVPMEEREDLTGAKLAAALQDVFARMDNSPGMMKCTVHYGGTNTGHLRLIPDPMRKPAFGFEVIAKEKIHARTTTPARYLTEGVRALHDEAFPTDGTAPAYVMHSLHMKPGGPPWRGTTVDELDAMEAYEYTPQKFDYSTPYVGDSSEKAGKPGEGAPEPVGDHAIEGYAEEEP